MADNESDDAGGGAKRCKGNGGGGKGDGGNGGGGSPDNADFDPPSAGNPFKQGTFVEKMAEGKAVQVEYEDSSDDEHDTIEHMRQERVRVNEEVMKLAGTKESKRKIQAALGSAVTTKARKTKSVNPFLSAVGQRLLSRWMFGKKDQIPPKRGRGLCGMYF
eukprot:6181632-Pleurochrysis_carterae.AAC.1